MILAKIYEEESEMISLVIEVLDDILNTSNTSKSQAQKAEEFGHQLIDFFRQNPQIDGKVLSEMSLSQFGNRMAEFCGNKRVKGIAAKLRNVCTYLSQSTGLFMADNFILFFGCVDHQDVAGEDCRCR